MKCKVCQKDITEEYQLCKIIGTGSYSQIYLVCNSIEPVFIAKKLYDNNDTEVINCKKVNKINGVNFSSFINLIYDENDNRPILIYDYIKGEIIENYFYKNNSNKEFMKIIYNVVKQLSKLESHDMYHLDINKNNIIIKDNKPYIIDYGTLSSSKDFEIVKANKPNKKRYFGSYGYVPPEFILDNYIVPSKFDVFSIGILLFEKFYNFNPLSLNKYYHLDCWFWCKNKTHDREKCLLEFMNKYNDKANDAFKYIMLKCLEFDPEKRASLEKLENLIEISCCC